MHCAQDAAALIAALRAHVEDAFAKLGSSNSVSVRVKSVGDWWEVRPVPAVPLCRLPQRSCHRPHKRGILQCMQFVYVSALWGFRAGSCCIYTSLHAVPKQADPESKLFKMAERAVAREWGCQPLFVREGGTMPVQSLIRLHRMLCPVMPPTAGRTSPCQAWRVCRMHACGEAWPAGPAVHAGLSTGHMLLRCRRRESHL